MASVLHDDSPGSTHLRLVEAGLRPVEALRATTTEPAAYLGASDRFGAIEPGMVADLALLEDIIDVGPRGSRP